MSIYICTICNNQKDSDFNCADLDGKECCEECFEQKQENDELVEALRQINSSDNSPHNATIAHEVLKKFGKL